MPHLSAVSRRTLYLYLLPLIVGPVLILVAAFFILPSPWFARQPNILWLPEIGYGARLHGANCQVVVYGDSSAEVGIDPSLVRQVTGLSVCNIAETEGMTVLNDTLVLNQYLEHNSPPRYIVFIFSPEDLSPYSTTERHSLFEPITYRMQQPNKLANLMFVMHHPEDGFRWAYVGMNMAITHALSKPYPPEILQMRERHEGRFINPDPPLRACTETHNSAPDKLWIQSLRSRYTNARTTVLIDSMPLPVCDRSLTFFQKELPGVTDNPVETFPMNVYLIGGRHVNAAGVVLLSKMLSDQLVQRLRSDTMAEVR
jgi:hypothetical protein